MALVAVAVSFVGGLSSMKKNKDERKLYNRELEQAPWAPPAWVFAPAWTINNFFLLMALQQVLRDKEMRSRNALLGIQGGIWFVFFVFGYVYFNRKSPVLAAILTVSDAALAAAAFVITNKYNKKLSYNYLPLLAWASFASTLGVYQALKNPDPVLGTKQLLH
ncbi:MAG: TspO/MBR family protein [Flavitalea sp.]